MKVLPSFLNILRETYRLRQAIRIDRREAAKTAAAGRRDSKNPSYLGIQRAEVELERLDKLLAALRYEIPPVFFFVLAFVTAMILYIGWSVDSPCRIPFEARIVTSHVSLTLLDAYSMTDGIAIVGDHLEMASDGALSIRNLVNSEMIVGDVMTLDFGKTNTPIPRERAVLNRLDIPGLSKVSFGHRRGRLELNVEEGELEAVVTARANFDLTVEPIGDFGEVPFGNVTELEPRRRPKLRLRSKASAQIDFEPNWKEVEFITMRASSVGFSRVSDSEANRSDCLVRYGFIRLPETNDEKDLHRGECLTLENFDGTVMVEGGDEGLIVHVSGETDSVSVGSDHYQVSVTPSILAVLMSNSLFQAIIAVASSIAVSLLAVHFEGRGSR